MKIGEKIKHFRELRNFSQSYMADKLDISQPYYSKIENGISDLTFSHLEQIVKVLEISLQDLLKFDPAQYFKKVSHSQIGYNFYHNQPPDEMQSIKDQLAEIKRELDFIKKASPKPS